MASRKDHNLRNDVNKKTKNTEHQYDASNELPMNFPGKSQNAFAETGKSSDFQSVFCLLQSGFEQILILQIFFLEILTYLRF